MPRFLTESTELIFGSLTNSSLQVAVLWILASIALRIMSRSSAAMRHQLLAATLLCGMLVPFLNSFLRRPLPESNRLTAALNGSRALSGPNVLETEITSMKKQTKNQIPDDASTQSAKRKEVVSDTSATFELTLQNAQDNNGTILSNFISVRTYGTHGLVCLWTIGMTILSLRFVIAQWQLRIVEKQFHRQPGYRDLKFAHTKMKSTWFRSAPVVMCSASEHTPMTWGIFHPKVLLPNSFSDWPASTLRAALILSQPHT